MGACRHERERNNGIATFESRIRMLKGDYSAEGIASGAKRHILFIGLLRYRINEEKNHGANITQAENKNGHRRGK